MDERLLIECSLCWRRMAEQLVRPSGFCLDRRSCSQARLQVRRAVIERWLELVGASEQLANPRPFEGVALPTDHVDGMRETLAEFGLYPISGFAPTIKRGKVAAAVGVGKRITTRK